MKLLYLVLSLPLLSGPIWSYDLIKEELASLRPEYRKAAQNFVALSRGPVASYNTDTYLKINAFCEIDPDNVSDRIELELPASHAGLVWRQSRGLRRISIVDATEGKTCLMSISKMNPGKPVTRRKTLTPRKNDTISNSAKPTSFKIWLFRVHGSLEVQRKLEVVRAFVWCERGIDSGEADPDGATNNNQDHLLVSLGHWPNPAFASCHPSDTTQIEPQARLDNDPSQHQLGEMSQPQADALFAKGTTEVLPPPSDKLEKLWQMLGTDGKENSDTVNCVNEADLDLLVSSFLI